MIEDELRTEGECLGDDKVRSGGQEGSYGAGPKKEPVSRLRKKVVPTRSHEGADSPKRT